MHLLLKQNMIGSFDQRATGFLVDAYSYLLLVYLGALLIVSVVFVVLRLKFPPIAPMEAAPAHREFVARCFRDLQS